MSLEVDPLILTLTILVILFIVGGSIVESTNDTDESDET